MVRLEVIGPRPVAITPVPRGERVLDVCDELALPIRFSCRSATCGICRVRVREGAGLLEPPAAEELEILQSEGASASERLACRLVVASDDGTVELEPVHARRDD